MKLYKKLADWWPLMSSPDHYVEEINLYQKIIGKYSKDIKEVLELGSGGGNNAYHLKKNYRMTLTDISPEMINVSKRLNPGCEHIVCDMRKVNLKRQFDLVFIHDAIMHMTREQDLLKVFNVAYSHLKKEGILFIAPDFFRETFKPSTDHGGRDDQNKSMRYLEWTYDKNPDDNVVETVYAYALKDEHGKIQIEHDETTEGIFSKKTWEKLLKKAGFKIFFENINHSQLELNSYIGIVGIKI